MFLTRTHPNTLNQITIYRQNLINNYRYLQQINPQLAIAPVLKSNAYGHGISEVAHALRDLSPPFFCVDSIYEAYQVQAITNKIPILILGYVLPEHLKAKKLPFWFTVFEPEQIEVLAQYQPKANVHIFVDTGMHREGVALNKLADLYQLCAEKSLKVVGLLSHLGADGQPRSKTTVAQLANFSKSRAILQQQQAKLLWWHLLASDGFLHLGQSIGVGNCARIGLSLYGLNKTDQATKLIPALEFSSQIIQLKQLAAGDKVGYDFTYTAPRVMTTAVIPAGYNDGVDKCLSNRGFIEVDTIPCPIIGQVNMNITVIDVSKVKNRHVGQKVIIYSARKDQPNSISQVAKRSNLTAYELLVHLNPITRRVLI